MSSPFYEKYSGLPQVSTETLPQSLKPSTYPKPISVDIMHTMVQATTVDQPAGGSSNISVPLNVLQGLIAGQTAALKIEQTLTNAPLLTFFKGALTDDAKHDLGSGSIYSAINRINVQYNNAQVTNLTNFRPFIDMFLAHGASSDFISRDASIMLGVDQNLAGTVKRTYIAPLVGIFATARSLPLWNGTGNLQLTIDWNSLNNSLYSRTGAVNFDATTASYKVSLIYTAILPPQEFVMQGKQQLASGGIYAFPYVDYQVVRVDTPLGGSQNYVHPVSTSSLRSVTIANYSTANLQMPLVNAISARGFTAAGVFEDDEGFNEIRVTCDAKPITNYSLKTALGELANGVGVSSEIFSELQKVFGRLYDSQRADSCTKANFDSAKFMIGVSTTRFGGDSGYDLVGTPCNSCTVSFTSTSAQPSTQYITFCMDKILAIDGTGNASVLH